MRRIVDVLLGLLLVTILGGAVMLVRQDRTESALQDTARQERRRFQQQVSLQSALERTELNERGFPTTIDPVWFNSDLPSNPLLGKSHPWVEVAPPGDRDRAHPRDIVAMDHNTALFWYNPQLGVIRARVPAGVSDGATVELYNYVNEADLTSLFSRP
jgi:type II secretory pathway pseudopilin PulG